MSVKRILATCLTMFLFFAGVASALEIVYPGNNTMVKRSDFLIVKAGEQPLIEALTIEINGVSSDPIDISSPEYKGAFRDFLILEPTWDKGKNTVTVKAYADGTELAVAKAVFFYVSKGDPVGLAPSEYQPFVMHLPEKEALCVGCHVMKPDNGQLRSTNEATNPCASCHKRMFAQRYVHGPEGVFQCIDCHDPASRPARWQVTKNDLTLCGECHTDKIEEYRKNAFVHGPVGVGNCVICHDPHASANPMQLQAPVNDLCIGCHSEILKQAHAVALPSTKANNSGHPVAGKKDPRNPSRPFTCISCHNPHGGAGRTFLIGSTTSAYGVCKYCHEK